MDRANQLQLGRTRMKTLTLAALLALSLPTFAEECEVEDMRWSWNEFGGMISIEGGATCRGGVTKQISIRAYEKNDGSDRFLGSTTTLILGFTFEALLFDHKVPPKNLYIKYAIHNPLRESLMESRKLFPLPEPQAPRGNARPLARPDNADI